MSRSHAAALIAGLARSRASERQVQFPKLPPVRWQRSGWQPGGGIIGAREVRHGPDCPQTGHCRNVATLAAKAREVDEIGLSNADSRA
jgi:hypothetical protein